MKGVINTWLWIGVCLGLALAGCVNLKPEPRKISYYSLEYPPPGPYQKSPLPVVLHVSRFDVAPQYDSAKMVYRSDEYHRDAYLYHRWWANPGDIVSYFLARDLRNSGLFKGVFTLNRSLPVSHTLEGTVEAFYEQDAGESWTAVLSVGVTLLAENEPDPSQRVLLQKEYSFQEPCRDKTPRDLAESMSRAMARLSRRVLADLYSRLARE